MKVYGIDISKYNYPVDFAKVKASGVKFVILRCSSYKYTNEPRGIYKDPYFETFYAGAKKVGLPVGAYFYSEARTIAEAQIELEFVLKCLKGKKFEYPIYLDLENQKTLGKTTKAQQTKVVKYILDGLEKEKYYAGLYTGKYIIKGEINISDLKDYDLWIASYTKECSYKPCQMWQFSGETNALGISTKVPGVVGNVADKNYCYVDYPTIIKENGLNGYEKPSKIESAPVDYVKELQLYLNKKYNCNLKIDGVFGKITFNAIKENLK